MCPSGAAAQQLQQPLRVEREQLSDGRAITYYSRPSGTRPPGTDPAAVPPLGPAR